MVYQISEEESDRIQFLKLVFCVMVIFIHSYAIDFSDAVIAVRESAWMELVKFTVSEIISRCAVPGFFLISAVLLYRKAFSWKKNVKRKIRSLLVPYFILNTFWIVFFYFVYEIDILSMFFSGQENRVSQWGLAEWMNAYFGMKGYPILYPLWFLRDLFVLNVLAKVLKLVIDRFPKIWFVLVVTTLVFNINLKIFFLSARALAFFSLGYYVVKYDLHFVDLDRINAGRIGFLYIILIALNYLTREFPVHIVFSVLSDTAGILFWARASRHLVGGVGDIKRDCSGLLNIISAYTYFTNFVLPC